MAAMNMPRQSDIARIAKVSQATVSMVLNGRASENGIPETTQARIREAILELGYVPNAAARSLRGGRNGLIGVHTFERVFPIDSDDYYNEFLNGVEAQAVDGGLDLVLFASTQRPDGSRSIYGNGSNRLRLADGAIMLGFEKNDQELERLAAEGYPFVFIGRRDVPGTRIPYVTADYHDAMLPVVRLLDENAHRSVVYIGAPVRGSAQQERLDGFLEHNRALGRPDAEVLFLSNESLTSDWLRARLESGVTAIVAESYHLVRILHRIATDEGISVPEELSVICLDTDPRGDREYDWSRVTVPRHEMGRRAVTLLMRVLDGQVGTDHFEVLHCAPPTTASVAAAHAADHSLVRE